LLWRRQHILVNNAGVLRSSAVEQISDAEWDLVVDTNLKVTFLCAQAVIAGMKSQRYGKIIKMASMAGRAIARELALYRINVNAVSPGIVDTPMVASALSPQQRQQLAACIPFERLAESDGVASLVAFLASDEAAYITGASVDIHGGELIIA
jgi:3-oxoacyl-[acyl-carrier protein] reductase